MMRHTITLLVAALTFIAAPAVAGTSPCTTTTFSSGGVVTSDYLNNCSLLGEAFVAEGTTADANETTLGFVDPVADTNIRWPALTAGTYALSTVTGTETLTNKTLAATNNVIEADTGDSATSFFAAGQIELARGGLGGDVSAYSTGIFGLLSGTLTDIDTFGEWVTAVGVTGTCDATTVVYGDGTCAASGTGGRSVTCANGICDADAELFTVTYSFPWLSSSIVATNDVLVDKVGATFAPTDWSCVADGGSALTTIDASIEECNTNGASCGAIGATSTVTAVNTTISDTSFTDTTLTAGNWLKFIFGTVTWTTPGTLTCTLLGTRYD